MLQIISGKFFNTEDLHISDGKGVLYSNYSWVQPIETCIGIMEPVDFHGDITTYVFNYKNKLEKKGLLVRTGDSVIIEQFKLIFSFFFQCFTDPDRNAVEMNCRATKRNINDQFLPNDFVGRIFEPKIQGSIEEVSEFNDFMNKVIGLEREKYNKFIQCINAYNNSLVALNYNFEIAYSLLIYCLESLGQSFDEFEATWDDYNQQVRLKLEEIFTGLDENKVNEMKTILLTDAHLKLQKRFVSFISKNINDNFFIEEAMKRQAPLRKSEVQQVLLNAYNIRSKYVHSLESIMTQLKFPGIGKGEIFYWENNPYLTYKGLLRLTHHVIKEYFTSQELVEKKDYNWEDALPGMIYLPLSEEYWLAETEGFLQEHSTLKLNGFLSRLERVIVYNESMIDLVNLMQLYEKDMPQSKKIHKLEMFGLYILYNLFLPKDLRVENYEKTIDRSKEILEEPSIVSLLVHVLFGQKLPWDSSRCEAIFKSYRKKKFNQNAINIPKYFEIMITLNIANIYLSEENHEKFDEYIEYAILDVPGNEKLQQILIGIRENKDTDTVELKQLFENQFYVTKESN
ncbi:hypothetical protein [Bacillus sp. GB_SG_008]|uniref:hypothetical protein n=1 Tax=Bacillus sp. GB_SG_008 TaxID=3454627 RepID=UPI003F87D403